MSKFVLVHGPNGLGAAGRQELLPGIMKKTGHIWRRPARSRAQVVRRVCERLEREYGSPRLGNPKNPVDDLVFIILSNKTGPAIARAVYRRLKRTFPEWDKLLASPARRVRSILKPAGLNSIKTAQLRAALRAIRRDFSGLHMKKPGGRSEVEFEEYLAGLPGVSKKVAKCVMLYTMGAKVLPVDAHVHRIAKRLGWTSRKRADQCHEELEALVPARRRYGFHVAAILHGRSACRPNRPACTQCCIRSHCMQAKGDRA